jgi:hypothetical protein
MRLLLVLWHSKGFEMDKTIKKKPNLGRIPLPKKAGFSFKDKSKYSRKTKHKTEIGNNDAHL